MASTEPEHPLGLQHLAGCLRLSAAAGWNQNEADWQVMLGMGRAWGITLADGTLAASALVLPYGADFGWISMVLVLPEQRRRGFATQLVRVAIAALEESGRNPVLDATPAGREVYRLEGFTDTWGFRRFALGHPAKDARVVSGVRPIGTDDWPRVLELDARAFGASREPLLRAMAARLPRAALVLERQGRVAGFLLGRDGRESSQLGPLVAEDDASAQALLQSALAQVPAPLYVDVTDRAASLGAFLERTGFSLQRPFTRMVRGRREAPGDPAGLCLVAGPELG